MVPILYIMVSIITLLSAQILHYITLNMMVIASYFMVMSHMIVHAQHSFGISSQ